MNAERAVRVLSLAPASTGPASGVATDTAPHSRAHGVGRVLGLTRVGIWVLLVLAAANGLFLYLLPGRADTGYAWSITAPVDARFMGAGFLAGTLATGLVLATVARWRTFSTLPPALWVLAGMPLAATIVHHDRFRWDYPPTWVSGPARRRSSSRRSRSAGSGHGR